MAELAGQLEAAAARATACVDCGFSGDLELLGCSEADLGDGDSKVLLSEDAGAEVEPLVAGKDLRVVVVGLGRQAEVRVEILRRG